jgi:hypothetical protein
MNGPDAPAYAAIYIFWLLGERQKPSGENLPPRLCRCDPGELVARRAGYHLGDELLARFLSPSCSVEVKVIDVEIFLANSESPAMSGLPNLSCKLYDKFPRGGTIDGHRTRSSS